MISDDIKFIACKLIAHGFNLFSVVAVAVIDSQKKSKILNHNSQHTHVALKNCIQYKNTENYKLDVTLFLN